MGTAAAEHRWQSQKYSSCKACASVVVSATTLEKPIHSARRQKHTASHAGKLHYDTRCRGADRLEMHNWRLKAVAATIRQPVMKVPQSFSTTFTTREWLTSTRHEMNAITYCDEQIRKLKIRYYARKRHAKYIYNRQCQWTVNHRSASATEDGREDEDMLAVLNTMAGYYTVSRTRMIWKCGYS